MKPIIGINCSTAVIEEHEAYRLNFDYVDAIRRAGGIPVLLPNITNDAGCAALYEKLDGLMFTGGNDISPERWGEKPHPTLERLHPAKEASDFRLTRFALEHDKPVLAICYGVQLLNVASGGSLHQHLPDLPTVNAVHGQRTTAKPPLHPIELKGDSRLAKLLGFRNGEVNSYHHCAVNKIGKGLMATAKADDGTIEGLESTQHDFVIGVQWHPERMPEDKAQRALFESFVRVAQRQR